MKNWLLSKVFGYIGKRFDGYKTKIGAIGLMLVAVAGIAGQIYPDQGLPVMDWDAIIGSFSAGLAAFGIGHKFEKQAQPSMTPQPAPASTEPTQEGWTTKDTLASRGINSGPPAGSGGFSPGGN